MTHVTCRLTAKNQDRLRNPVLGNRERATFTFFYVRDRPKQQEPRGIPRTDSATRRVRLKNYLQTLTESSGLVRFDFRCAHDEKSAAEFGHHPIGFPRSRGRCGPTAVRGCSLLVVPAGSSAQVLRVDRRLSDAIAHTPVLLLLLLLVMVVRYPCPARNAASQQLRAPRDRSTRWVLSSEYSRRIYLSSSSTTIYM